ncbi:MFS transporter [Salinibacterium hongtaonis]|uniref:MFS transporter n=1 Tax=Homoserinimonas hongtaonis TaxID=2079791 RepID=UPI000D3B6467|nr:MFS transporter [Salinibacterium hongtaonis]AWB88743.1 MFS transporter [Salinibacterium hongtaonis]
MSTEQVTADPRRWKALAFISLAVSLIIMDATVVNVAVPTIIQDLGLTASDAEWMNSIYALVFAALLITAGRVGDLYGRKKLFIIGVVVFGIASVLAALSDTASTLIFARLIQGVGGAMIMPTALSSINTLFVGRERGIAFAVWGGTIGGMAAVGPLVGGWLTTAFSWHWAFLINVPVVIIVLIGAGMFLRETRDVHARRGLDFAGILLSSIGLAAFVFGLIEGLRYGWWEAKEGIEVLGVPWGLEVSPVPFAFALAIILLTIFVLVERARGRADKPVLLDLSLLHIRSFSFGSIAALVVSLGEFGLLYALPLFLQGGLGLSALDTGILIVWLALGTFIISARTPALTRRLGARGVVRLGLALEVIAIIGLGVTISLDTNTWVYAGWLFLYGAGVGMATAQLTSVILIDVPVQQSGQASGLQSTFRQVGSAIGIAILGSLLVTSLGSMFSSALDDVDGIPQESRSGLVTAIEESAGAAIPEISAVVEDQLTQVPGVSPEAAAEAANDVQRAAEQSMVSAARITMLSAAGVVFLGLLATFALPRVRSDEDEAETATTPAGSD